MKTRLLGIELMVYLFLLGPAFAQSDLLDPTFNPGSGISGGTVFSLALNTNGQVVIGGSFTSFNNQSRNYVARLNSDGSLDNGFLPMQGPDGLVLSVVVGSDDSIYLGGQFMSYNNITRASLAKLRSDGSLDPQWPGVSIDGHASLVQLQPDGKLIAVGTFTHVNGIPRMNIVRLKADGSVDPNFNPAMGISDGGVATFVTQGDGGIILGGSFTTNSPVARQCLVRVNAAGVMDPSFNAGYVGVGRVDGLALQPDGKILVAGTFTSINGYSRLGVARLNTNGAVDQTFISSFDATMMETTSGIGTMLLPDQSVLLFGNTGTPGPALVHLSHNGSYDANFVPGANYSVNCAAIQPDGRLLVGGTFTALAGTNINGVARLVGFGNSFQGFQFLDVRQYAGMMLSGTVSNSYRIEMTTNPGTASLWTPLFNVMMQTNPQLIIDPTPIGQPQRFYRAVALP